MGAYLMWQGNTMFFDVVPSETQKKANTITEHPVETGADISDHVRPDLDRVTLEGFISQTPLFKFDARGNPLKQRIPESLSLPTPPLNATTLLASISTPVGAISVVQQNGATPPINVTVTEFPDFVDYVRDAIQTLDQLRLQATLITVVTPSWVYNNMLIESIEISGSPEHGTGRSFTVELREIRVVATSTVAAPIPTVPRAAVKQNNGKQTAAAPEPQKESAAFNLGQRSGVIR